MKIGKLWINWHGPEIPGARTLGLGWQPDDQAPLFFIGLWWWWIGISLDVREHSIAPEQLWDDLTIPRPYRKRPLMIRAVQADGSPESNRAIIDWTRGTKTPASMDHHPERGKCLSIATLEGAMWVSPGDWIIQGVHGEFYPCKPDVFGATYEPVNPWIEGGDRQCRVCGCTDFDCSDCVERTGSPCHWVESDLCSACVSEGAP